MTLDEAIKNTEIIAEENQRVVDTGVVFDDVTIDMLYCDDTEVIEKHLANYQRRAEEYRQISEWLKELKQLREQTRWIPVSEGSPKVAGCYSVTRKIGSDLIVDACFFDGINTWYDDSWMNDERNHLTNVVAWMQKSKPYVAEAESEEV